MKQETRKRLQDLLDRIQRTDDLMGERNHAPTGGDYNTLYDRVTDGLRDILRVKVMGRLWWTANDTKELYSMVGTITQKGMVITRIERRSEGTIYDVIFELEKARASELLGYDVADEEWLTE